MEILFCYYMKVTYFENLCSKQELGQKKKNFPRQFATNENTNCINPRQGPKIRDCPGKSGTS